MTEHFKEPINYNELLELFKQDKLKCCKCGHGIYAADMGGFAISDEGAICPNCINGGNV